MADEDYKAQYEALAKKHEAATASVTALEAKVNELLAETKTAKDAKRAAEKAAEDAAKKKAGEEGDYKALLESSEKERAKLQEALQGLQTTVAQKETGSAAMKLAAKLADGENAELLAQLIGPRLTYADGSVKITDGQGNLTVSTLADLEKEVSGSARYASLLRGRQASGGGASGGSGASGTDKTVSRADFDKMGDKDRIAFVKGGGKVTND